MIGINVFGHDDLTAKYCYFKRSKPPDVDEIQSQSQGQLICRGQAEKLDWISTSLPILYMESGDT